MALFISRKLCVNKLLSYQKTITNLNFHHSLSKINHHQYKIKKLNLINNNNNNVQAINKRNFFWIFKKRSNKEILIVDQPPPGYELIYRTNFDNYLFTLQHLAFYGAILVGIFTFYHLREYLVNEEEFKSPWKFEKEKDSHLGGKGLSLATRDELILIIASYWITLLIVQIFMGKFPVRIYRSPNEQSHILYCFGPVPNSIKKINVLSGTLKPTPEGIVRLFKEETYKINKTGEKFVFLTDSFKCPRDLYNLIDGEEKNPNDDDNEDDLSR